MNAIPSYPDLPRAVDLEPQAKKRLLAGIKTVLARLQERGAVPAMDYAEMLGKPAALQAFVAGWRAHPIDGADVVVDAAGRPVQDATTPLVCGLNLAQVQQMLVFTCAKRLFLDDPVNTRPPVPAAQGLGGLFKRKEAPPPKSDAEKKLDDLKPLLAFDWQLPLLKYYYFFLDRRQIAELGRELLLLRSVEQLEPVCAFDAPALRQARAVTGPLFPELLLTRPAAIANLGRVAPADFALFRALLGARVWEFYARDPDYIEDVSALDHARLEALAPVLPFAAPDAVTVLCKIPPERAAAVVEGFVDTFGGAAELLFADAAVARQTIAPVVERFIGVMLPDAEFREVVGLKCRALKPALLPWLDKRKR